MILATEDKVLVVHRRIYKEDCQRYFVGTVDGYENGIAKVCGYTWVRDRHSGRFVGRGDRRTKIFSISSGTLIVYQLPATIDVEGLSIVEDEHLNCYLTDGSDFRLDLTEALQNEPAGV